MMFSQCVAPKSSCIDEIIMCTDGTKVSTIVDKMSTQAKLITDYPCVRGGAHGTARVASTSTQYAKSKVEILVVVVGHFE